MIARTWRGWTTRDNANAYEHLLRSEIFPGIFAKQLPGFERIDLFRRDIPDETEFMTVMWFSSSDALIAFVGEDPGVAFVPDSARKILARFDARSAHYDVRASIG